MKGDTNVGAVVKSHPLYDPVHPIPLVCIRFILTVLYSVCVAHDYRLDCRWRRYTQRRDRCGHMA
jgi:hypothetical protein